MLYRISAGSQSLFTALFGKYVLNIGFVDARQSADRNTLRRVAVVARIRLCFITAILLLLDLMVEFNSPEGIAYL